MGRERLVVGLKGFLLGQEMILDWYSTETRIRRAIPLVSLMLRLSSSKPAIKPASWRSWPGRPGVSPVPAGVLRPMLVARLVALGGPGWLDAQREFLRIAEVTERISDQTRCRGGTAILKPEADTATCCAILYRIIRSRRSPAARFKRVCGETWSGL